MLLLSILMIVSVTSFAQRTEKVTAAYTYYVPENVTLEEAKHTALDRAKLTAIADAFGTLVSQSNSTVMVNENGQTDSRFFSFGGSEVKGEWIETTKEPIYNIRYEGNMLVVSVEVTGRIREIVSAGVDFTAKILRNGIEEKFESNEFRNGDDMYLYFKSPIDGYLLAYMFDETTNQVVRILPYIKSTTASIQVKGGEDYLFFNKEKITDYMVDEYTMTANQPVEFNTLYVIFSTTSIIKAYDSSDESKDGIRILKYEDFNKWLVGIRKQTSVKIMEHTIKVKQ
jgi:hypothetical protein